MKRLTPEHFNEEAYEDNNNPLFKWLQGTILTMIKSYGETSEEYREFRKLIKKGPLYKKGKRNKKPSASFRKKCQQFITKMNGFLENSKKKL